MSAPSDRIATFVVPPTDTGLRLDRFLQPRLPERSRRGARTAIQTGAVAVNGRRGRKGDAVHAGDVVRLDLSLLDGDLAAQAELPLPVLFVDETLVAVDKPAGMPAVALRAGDRGTVANALLGRYPQMRGIGNAPFETGIAHRLDTPTSGVLLAARTAAAWQRLRAQFTARRVEKLYLAVVDGAVPRNGSVLLPVAHDPARPRRMRVCADPRRATALRARSAHTRYRPLRVGNAATLLAVRIRTGARHQIRVHLASIGHPILGDAVYGDRRVAAAAPRLLLHAARLGLTHPASGRRIVLRSPVPVELTLAELGRRRAD